MPTAQGTPRRLPLPAGEHITLREFAPADASTKVRGAVVIGGAMGVPQRFYAPFAAWLAQQGWRVTTFDYLGMGESWPAGRSLRHCRADLVDWATHYQAAIDSARAAQADGPLLLLGHSLGAQLPGLLTDKSAVDGLVSVASGSGYRGENAPALRRKLPIFWGLAVPLLTPLVGYFPGQRLRMVGDLPRGVILQWRKWCQHPHYMVGAEGAAVRARYEQVRFPIYALSVDDDEMMTLQGTHSLMGFYPHAPRRIERLAAAQVGAARVGHFGLFKPRFQPDVWPLLARTLADWPQAVGHGGDVRVAAPVQPVSATPHVQLPAVRQATATAAPAH
ncbi:MAG: alpha/beta fold hydrolase [Pseudomonadota bacterium]|nr:alpha/beta fold hydrolase [Pseudomonadota bacterium]